MRQSRKQLDSFNGGGYSNVFTQQLDTGFVYDEIALRLANINIDQVLQIELVLNGDSIVNVDGQHFKDLDAHFGEAAESGILRIPFKDLSLKTDAGQNLSALATEITDNLVLKVRVGAATQAQIDAGSVPGLSGYYFASSYRQRVVLPRIYQENIAIGMSGLNNYKTFETGPAIRRMFFKDNGRIDEFRVRRNNQEIVWVMKADNANDLKRQKLNTVANQFVFSPVMTHFGLTDMLQTAGTKLEFLPTVSAAGDIAVVIHTLENAVNPKASPMAALAQA